MAKRKIRVAINGFGRIGRAAFKIMLQKSKYEVVAINDLASAESLAYLLKYDTVYGRFPKKIFARGNDVYVNGKKYQITAVPEPKNLPWKKMKIDVVLECTGRFVKDGLAADHIKAGAKKVIISAPSKGGDVDTFLLGVNEETYKGQKVISNASCTTNCIAPVAQIMVSKFGVEKAMMTTIHSYTADQSLVDGPHKKDFRRGRSAAENIVPTSTGAAVATGLVVPELQGLFDGLSLRVPTPVVSLSDFTFVLKKNVTVSQVNNALIKASKSKKYLGILGVTDEPVVSSDFIGDTRSSIVDLTLTQVVGGNMVKVIAWYDNEWGYSNRLVEMIDRVA